MVSISLGGTLKSSSHQTIGFEPMVTWEGPNFKKPTKYGMQGGIGFDGGCTFS